MRPLDQTICGDYPAPCNCDDPLTHDGAVTYHDLIARVRELEAKLVQITRICEAAEMVGPGFVSSGLLREVCAIGAGE